MGRSWNESDTMTSVVIRGGGENQRSEPRACIVHVSERVLNTSTRVLDTGIITIGRGSECSVQIPCSHISRVHARIEMEGDGWVVHDNSSVNGLLINGTKKKSAKLRFGDRIDLGRGEVLLFRPYDSDYQRALEAQKLESLGRLASGIAHDFNNVLMAIVGATSCLEDDFREGDMAKVAETTADIMTASRRGADLAKQLLSFSRQGKLVNDQVSVADVVEEVTRLAQHTFDQKIRVQMEACNQSLVVADRGQLVQVLMNLCINARDAMPEGGDLAIEICDESPTSSTPAGRFVCIRVTDTGVGMTQEVRDRVFEPFFSTKGEGLGTGLGMATAYGIVRNYGGTIEIQSDEGLGTTVSVYLPSLAVSSDAQDVSAKSDANRHLKARSGEETKAITSGFVTPNQHTRLIARSGEGRCVLLAEDQTLVRRHTSRLLRRLGYRVLEAQDGVEAVDLVARGDVFICLALLDLQMPRRSGDEACRMIRSIDSELPVIMVSGNVEDPRIEALVATNDVEVLAKPFAPDDLAVALAHARSQ